MATTGLAGLDHWAASWAALPVGLLEVCLMARSEAFPAASQAESPAVSRVALSAGFESIFPVPPTVAQALAGRWR
jgi:hypothetical protein